MLSQPVTSFSDLSALTPAYFEQLRVKAVLLDLDDTLIPEHQGEFPDGFIQWLQQLQQAGIKVGIVSNNQKRSYCRQVLKHLNTAGLDIPIVGDSLKPFPDSFKKMLLLLDVTPSEAIMIGDGILTDRLGAYFAGIDYARAQWFPRSFYQISILFVLREILVCLYDLIRRGLLNHRPKLYLSKNSQYRQAKRFLVMMNPQSSQTNETTLRQLLDDETRPLGITLDYVVHNNPMRGLKKYRSKIAENYYDAVVACGGDGTVRAVIETVFHSDASVPVGILPTGTGNLVAKGLGIPQDLHEAVNVLLTGHAQSQSVTVVNGKYVALLVVGIGVDAEIMQETTSALKKSTGILSYVISGIKVGLLKDKSWFQLKLDGKQYRHRADGILLIHRNHYLKAFVPAQLETEKNDQVLDVCVIQTHSVADALPVISALFRGEYDQAHGMMSHYQGKNAVIHTFPQELVQIDGDVVPLSVVKARLVSDAVEIIAPKEPSA